MILKEPVTARARKSKQNTNVNIKASCQHGGHVIDIVTEKVLEMLCLTCSHTRRSNRKTRRHLARDQLGKAQLMYWHIESCKLAQRTRFHISIRQSPSWCNAIGNTWKHARASQLYDLTLPCYLVYIIYIQGLYHYQATHLPFIAMRDLFFDNNLSVIQYLFHYSNVIFGMA